MTARSWQTTDYDNLLDSSLQGSSAAAPLPVDRVANDAMSAVSAGVAVAQSSNAVTTQCKESGFPRGADRRVAPRRPHRVFQWIAPCIDERLPDRSMFYQVQCVDISTTGIAFYTAEQLSCEHCIVALGTTDDAFYVRARIIEQRPLEYPARDDGGARYRIGCEFVERYGKKE